MFYKKYSFLFLFVIGLTNIKAQETIPASGGNASGSGGSVSYTIGQIVYTTDTATSGSVAQGVQQAFEISVVTEIKEANNITLNCSAFPNPTTDNLILKIENFQLSTFNFQLLDINGKLLENKKISSNVTFISMENLIPATYLLKISNSNIEIKTFKIIKY